MIWAFIAAVLAGFAAGCFFRATMLVLMSAFTALGACVGGLLAGWGGLTIAWFAMALTATVQFAFLAGAALAHGRERVRQKMVETAEARQKVKEEAGVSRPNH